MSEHSHPDSTPVSPEPSAPPAVADQPKPGAKDGKSAKGMESGRLAILLALLLAVLLAWQWWDTREQTRQLRRDMAQRLQAGDSVNHEARALAQSVRDGFAELQTKVGALEARQVEAQSQQLALEQLYQNLSRSRDEWAMAEIEQVLSTASQQLQLSGNVRGALIALQNADNRLALSDTPQFITIRRALGADIEKLKTLPSVDLTGLALRLDNAIAQIDSMPLLAEEKPVQPNETALGEIPAALVAEPAAEAPSGRLETALAQVRELWNALAGDMWSEIRQLVRVRSVSHPESLLLSPTETFYARENLKLRLLSARLSLLARKESTLRSDLVGAQATINRYFDTSARQTKAVQALLQQVHDSDLSIEMPSLADSLNAVRNYKATP